MPKSFTSVQLVPFHDSVRPLLVAGSIGKAPPNTSANVVVPDEAAPPLPELTSVISVHEEPFHCSTFVYKVPPGPVDPVITKAAVEVPVPETCALA